MNISIINLDISYIRIQWCPTMLACPHFLPQQIIVCVVQSYIDVSDLVNIFATFALSIWWTADVLPFATVFKLTNSDKLMPHMLRTASLHVVPRVYMSRTEKQFRDYDAICRFVLNEKHAEAKPILGAFHWLNIKIQLKIFAAVKLSMRPQTNCRQ